MAEIDAPASSDAALRWEVGRYRSLHSRAVEREASLKQEVERLLRIVGDQGERIDALLLENEKLRARQAWLEQQLFGHKSEQSAKGEDCKEQEGSSQVSAAGVATSKRKRGQQPGSRGHGRKRRDDLPTEEIPLDIAADKKACPRCGKSLKPFPWTEDCEEIHWEVRVIRRLYRRARYLPACDCGALPGIVAAPLPPKLIAKGMFSTEFWTQLLHEKFLFQHPLYRVRQALMLEGLNVSLGTLTGGLKKIGPLLEPLYAGIVEHSRRAEHWHMDETRWQVFADLEGKTGHRWWLWVCVTSETCVYVLDPTRSAGVPQNHLGSAAKGILSADRYSAYKTLENIQIAFCWAHVRRDFLRVRDGYRQLAGWGQAWVDRVDELFEINARRLDLRALPDFAAEDQILRQALAAMVECRQRELACPDIHAQQRKVLESLSRHWKGLTIFVERPDIPMDNNEAERRLRNPIVGRKNYYGSGAIWSGKMSAMIFTIFQTLLINKIDPKKYLLEYFRECARQGGKPPEGIVPWLPWNLAAERKASWRYPIRPP